MHRTTLIDIVGPEYTKLGFFREVQDKLAELQTYNLELEEKKQEIQDIINGIMDLLAVISSDYRIVFVNKVFHDYFDSPCPQGKLCFEVFRHRTQPCAECLLDKVFQTGQSARTSYIEQRGETRIHFEVVISPMFDDKGQVRTVLVAKRDVTLEKEYQAKYYQSEKMATIGLLAAGVAHEINNPLAAISGFSEALKRRLPYLETKLGQDDPEIMEDFNEYLSIILDECNRCRDIVGNLLSFSSQKICRMTTINLNELVSDTLKILQHQMKLHPDIELVQSLNTDPVMVQGVQSELKQVLLNLVLNAVDAINNNGVITIKTLLQPGYATLVVEDSGHGIDPAIQTQLFIPFFTTKTHGHSIGIGLSTCYNIIQRHGGEILVCSEREQGTIFRVKLPMEQSASKGA